MNLAAGNGWGGSANPNLRPKRRSSLSYMIPLAIVKTYRFIPPSIRALWSFGTSSSHLALASPSWTSLLYHGTPKFSGKDGTWDQVTKFGTDTYNTGWPEGTPGTSMKVFKMFVKGWMLLPFMLLLPDWGGAPGWGPSSSVRSPDLPPIGW
jgi:hypothetical protein